MLPTPAASAGAYRPFVPFVVTLATHRPIHGEGKRGKPQTHSSGRRRPACFFWGISGAVDQPVGLDPMAWLGPRGRGSARLDTPLAHALLTRYPSRLPPPNLRSTQHRVLNVLREQVYTYIPLPRSWCPIPQHAGPHSQFVPAARNHDLHPRTVCAAQRIAVGEAVISPGGILGRPRPSPLAPSVALQ